MEAGIERERLDGERNPLPPCGENGYAGFLDTVPVALGAAVAGASWLLARLTGTGYGEWGTMSLYAFLASLVVAGCADQALARHAADLLRHGGRGRIPSSFRKACVFLLAGGGAGYGGVLALSGTGRGEGVFSWILFMLLTLAWTAMVYIAVLEGPGAAARACASVLLAFFFPVLFLAFSGADGVKSLLFCVAAAAAVLPAWAYGHIKVLCPGSSGNASVPAGRAGRYMAEGITGAFLRAALYGCPAAMYGSLCRYGMPALYVFLPALVLAAGSAGKRPDRFLRAFRDWQGLLDGNGTAGDLGVAWERMCGILKKEPVLCGKRQVRVTLAFLAAGVSALAVLRPGNSLMPAATFGILCAGYGLYSTAVPALEDLLGSGDFSGAAAVAAAAAVTGIAMTAAQGTAGCPGTGFLCGAAVFSVLARLRFGWYARNLPRILPAKALLSRIRSTDSEGGNMSACLEKGTQMIKRSGKKMCLFVLSVIFYAASALAGMLSGILYNVISRRIRERTAWKVTFGEGGGDPGCGEGCLCHITGMEITYLARRKQLAVRMEWKNSGTAPAAPDREWPVVLHVFRADGGPVASQALDLDLSALPPGGGTETLALLPYPGEIRDGYRIGVSIGEPEGGGCIRLAQETEILDGTEILYTCPGSGEEDDG